MNTTSAANPAGQVNPMSIDQTEGTSQYLTFVLASEEYGVDILKVREIRGWEQPTVLPNSSDFILGVINLRGAVVPVVDMRRRFGLPQIEHGKTTVVIVVRVAFSGRERTIGMVVDSVSEVYHIAAQSIRPAPDMGRNINSEYIKGLATEDGKMIILLDIDHLINAGMLQEIVRENPS